MALQASLAVAIPTDPVPRAAAQLAHRTLGFPDGHRDRQQSTALGKVTLHDARTRLPTPLDMNLRSALAFLALLLALPCTSSGAVLVGPFVPGSGTYSLIPGGDFESGDMGGWADIMPALGVFRPTKEQSVSGAFSTSSTTVTAGTGPGFGAGRIVPVTPGRTYDLSAFLFAKHLQGHLYVDLNDVAFSPSEGGKDAVGAAAGIPQWQFAYAKFTVPPGITQVHVRMGHDLTFPIGEYGFVDDVAITAESAFKAPIPEHSLTIEVSEVRLCWQTAVGVRYQLQSRSATAGSEWTNVGRYPSRQPV